VQHYLKLAAIAAKSHATLAKHLAILAKEITVTAAADKVMLT